MATDYVWKVQPGSKVKLKDYDPDDTPGESKHDDVEKQLDDLGKEISELQELLAAAQRQSMLIILQGMDTSGKDGTIRHVFNHINPQGCYVQSFKEPTGEDLAHDFLWRIHKCTPGKGSIGIFNRSHYEDVLVARVQNLVPKPVWQARYKEINDFERLLANSSTIILKFFLHISFDEQAERLEAREKDRDKAWKLSASDWETRKHWDAYQEAYEDVLSKCSTEEAPWYIVPANHKWYRNLAISHVIARTMHRYKDEWQADLEERGKLELEKLNRIKT